MYKFKNGYYADVRIEDRFAANAQYQNGQLREAKETVEKKAFIRVFDGKMWYYTSTSDVNNVQKALDDLYGYATFNPEINENPIVAKYQVNKDEIIRFAQTSVKNIPLKDKLKLILDASDRMNSDLCSFKSARYIDRYSVYEFYSSKGAQIKYDFQTCGVAYGMAFNYNGENLSEQLSKCETEFGKLIYSDNELSEFVTRCESYIQNAKPITAGSYPIILAPIATGVFAHESFGHKSESDFMLGDENMAKE